MLITVREALDKLDESKSWRNYQLDYKESVQGNFEVQNFTIPREDDKRIELIMNEGMDRDPGHGTFTRLVEYREYVPGRKAPIVWMSDTRAEIMEHSDIFNKLWWCNLDGGPKVRLLINGLGLGLVVHGALRFSEVEHIDVVENNNEIADLIEPLITDSRVAIHRNNAYDIEWPRGTRWDFAWHDIWPEIDDRNLPGMRKIMGKYRRRVHWQDCWQRRGCLRMERAFRRARSGKMDPREIMDIMEGRMVLLCQAAGKNFCPQKST